MDGFLNFHKPPGWTSHDVVARVRSLLKIKKVGHTGTLDPPATGVLPLCLGKATKLAQFLTESDKEYRAVLRLGETTDTQDATGKTLTLRPVEGITEDRIREALEEFKGEVLQLPPMYSAVKVNGRRLYQSARAGLEVARRPRTISVHRMDLIGMEGRDVSLDVECSKGTYIRTLCADLGDRLGTGAHLWSLERRRSGPFRIEDAVGLSGLEEAAAAGRIPALLRSPEEVLRDFPALRITREGEKRVLNGATFGWRVVLGEAKEFKTGQPLLVYNALGLLIALARVVAPAEGRHPETAEGAFRVDRLLI